MIKQEGQKEQKEVIKVITYIPSPPVNYEEYLSLLLASTGII